MKKIVEILVIVAIFVSVAEAKAKKAAAKKSAGNIIEYKCVGFENDLKNHPACTRLRDLLKEKGCDIVSGGGGGGGGGAGKKMQYSGSYESKKCKQVKTGSKCAKGTKAASFTTIVDNKVQNNQICVSPK